MQNKINLSVVISAYNEDKKIRACLDSVRWADEIIFLDNSSTDKTTEIASGFTKNIITQPNDPKAIDLQKNTGIEKAKGDWILILDADEQVTPELAEEMKQLCHSREGVNPAQNETVNGYWIPRKNIIFGKWIMHSGWYPDHQLRLFRKGMGKYENQHYHEPLKIDGKTEHLKENIVHHNYETITQFLSKHMTVYAPNEAENLLKNGYEFSWQDAIRMPLHEFLSRYFAREGYKDGFHGLMLSLLMAAYHLSIFAYLWEKTGFKDLETQKFTSLQIEINTAGKELKYWFYNEKIKDEKNLLKTIWYKFLRKVK